MNYASLDEIYDNKPFKTRQNNYDDIIKNILKTQKTTESKNIPDPIYTDNTNYTKYPKIPKFTNEITGPELEKKIEKFENQPKKEKISINLDDNDDCMKLLDHMSKCEKCREFIMKKMNLYPKTTEDKKREEMLDVAIYILTGVFVLFLLDSFMNLGKFLKR